MSLTNGLSKMDTSPAGQLIIKANVGDDIRRIPIHNDDLTYDELILMMQRVFKGVLSNDEELVLKYKDEDGDLVSLVDTNDLSSAIQNSRVLRLTILQQGDMTKQNSVINKDVVKELREIRDKVNSLLDSITIEQGGKQEVEEKTDDVVEEISESINSHLNLEQSKEFDPLAGQEQTPTASSSSPGVDSSEKSRQVSGQSSVSTGSGQQPQYPGHYNTPVYPPQSTASSSTTPQPYPARPSYPGSTPPSAGYQPPAAAPSSGGYQPPAAAPPSGGYQPPAAAPPSGGYQAPPSTGFPPSASTASATAGYPSVPAPTGAPSTFPPGPPSSLPASSFTTTATTDSSQSQPTTSYAANSSAVAATSAGYQQQQHVGYPQTGAAYPGYAPAPGQSYQTHQPHQTAGAGGMYPPGNYGPPAAGAAGANPYSRGQPGQGQTYPRPPQ